MTTPCRSCGTTLDHIFCDLGVSPLSNSFLTVTQLAEMEPHYPLRVMLCTACYLVQLPEVKAAREIFTSDYAYFSSYSESWLDHVRAYVQAMVPRLGLGADSLVVEIASNDGYLLQYFTQRNIPVLGIEPAGNCAAVAQKAGIPTLVRFFDSRLAGELRLQGKRADLLLGNNVLAHVPDLNDFVAGMKLVLAPRGVITMEFPYLLNLMRENQFDTIYHEHYSYFSLHAVENVFHRHSLKVFDVEPLATHGGSLRVYAVHADDARADSPALMRMRRQESEAGVGAVEFYGGFAERVRRTKRKLLDLLTRAKDAGQIIAAYGAAAKGNTLLNYCGVRTDFIDYAVDRSPYKQGKFMPGTHIPILHPERLRETRPDYVLILPWNLKDEITAQLAYVREWGGKFIVPIPEPMVLE